MIGKKSLNLWRQSLLFGVFWGMISVHAVAFAEYAKLSDSQATSQPLLRNQQIPASQGGEFEDELIRSNIYISRFFDDMATGLDLFLAGQQYTTQPNKTSVSLESGFYYNTKDGYNDGTSLNVNLRLPNVEEYWQVAFTSYDQTAERGISQTYLRQRPRTQDYGASLEFFKQLGEVRASFQPRASFAGSFKISHTLTVESLAKRGDSYRANPKLQFYADPDKGTGMFQAFNFNFVLSRYYNITFVNEGDYLDRLHQYTVTQGFALGEWFTQTMTMSYNLFFTFTNRPNYQLASVNVSTSFTQEIYKNIFDYQVIPNVDYASKYGYWGNPGINLRLNLRF